MTRKAGLGRENIYQDSKRLATLIAASSGAAGPHNVLSATHTDAATTAATRGDLIIADDTPQWDALAIGGANTYLKSDGTDPAWATVAMGEVTGGDAQFVTLAVSAGLANERVLTAGEGVTLTDAGAGSTITASLTWGTPTIGTIECDDAAAAGTSTNPARSDHQHAIVCAAPATNLSVSSSNAEGDAASFARSNHIHAVTSSSNPGAAASILASDASGHLQLVRLGAGVAPSYPLHAAGYIFSEGDGIESGFQNYHYTDDATGPYWSPRKARGSKAVPAIVQQGDDLLRWNVFGYDGAAWAMAARILVEVDGVPGADDMPGRISFDVSPAGFDTPEMAARIRADKTFEVYGDISIDSGVGIIHTDGVTDGQVLVADGTRYVPGNLSDITGGDAQYVVMTADGTLANERVLTAGDGLDRADGGAGSTVTLTVDVTDILGSGLTESANNIDLAWGTPTIGTIECDDAANAGTSTNPARSDHQHAIVCAAAGTISPDDSAAEGSAASFARSDHVHEITCAAPVANLSVSSTDAEGDASSFARSNHTHAIDSSSAPGAAASLLATDASGFVTVVQATATSKIYVNETACASVTIGFVANQGGNDDDIWVLKSSDVAHNMLDLDVANEADTWGRAHKQEPHGGMTFQGFKDADGVAAYAMEICGFVEQAAATGKTNTDGGVVNIRAAITDGDDGVTTVATAGNLLSIRNNSTTAFMFGADSFLYCIDGGGLYVNESDDTLMTVGVCVNQGANDDQILSFKSSDVAHGASDIAETDTWFAIKKAEAAAGGAQLRGIKDADGSSFAALQMKGYLAENAQTTKGTSNLGIVTINGYQTSGASIADTVADGIVFSIVTHRGGSDVSVLHVDEDGDLDIDGTTGTFDAEDDVALIRELSEVLAQPRGQVSAFAATERPRSAELGIITIDEGGVMMSTKRHGAVLRGAILQLEERLRRLEA